ncbi:hypothetical protein ABKN59_007575 [Abortiporus biennis]
MMNAAARCRQRLTSRRKLETGKDAPWNESTLSLASCSLYPINRSLRSMALVAFALRYEHDSDFYNFVLNSPKLFTTFSIFTPYFYQFQDSKHIMRSNILFVVFAIFSATLPAFCVPVVFDSGSFAVARSNIPKYRKRALGNRLFGRSDEIPSTTVESTPPLPNESAIHRVRSYVKRAEHIKGLINSIATEMELSERELRELSQMSRGINPEPYEGGNTLAKRDADVTTRNVKLSEWTIHQLTTLIFLGFGLMLGYLIY